MSKRPQHPYINGKLAIQRIGSFEDWLYNKVISTALSLVNVPIAYDKKQCQCETQDQAQPHVALTLELVGTCAIMRSYHLPISVLCIKSWKVSVPVTLFTTPNTARSARLG